jgi:hypothetical protein
MATVADFKKAYTNTYWVTFANRKPGCIDCAPDDDPIAVASALGEIKTIDSLPYPADPVLHRDPNDKTPCPSMTHHQLRMVSQEPAMPQEPLPYTRESIVKAKQQQQWERLQAAREMGIPSCWWICMKWTGSTRWKRGCG